MRPRERGAELNVSSVLRRCLK